jgi:hypothetical protein
MISLDNEAAELTVAGRAAFLMASPPLSWILKNRFES